MTKPRQKSKTQRDKENKALKSAATAEVKEAATMKDLQAKLFPLWKPLHADIFEKIASLKDGMYDDSVNLSELLVLYPGAVDDVNYLKLPEAEAKKKFCARVEEWLASNMLVNDMHNYSKMFMEEVKMQIAETKKEIVEKYDPIIAELKDEIKQLRATANLHEKILKKKDVFDREIIVTNPQPPWDLSKPKEETIETAEKFLRNVANNGKLPPNSVVSIREIESAYGTEDPRFSVIMATQNIKQEIAHNASNDENFKKKIRHGVPPHVRQEKVRLRNYRIMSSQLNWESQQQNRSYYSRVEIQKDGEPIVQQYRDHCPQVSHTKAKAKRKELTEPKGFKEEFRQLVSASILTSRA